MLAGGAGRRLGGVDKPGLVLGGSRLLDRALAACAGSRTVVVGAGQPVPHGVLVTAEEPPGSGPAAALVAGLRVLSGQRSPDGQPMLAAGAVVALLAADLPAITAGTVRRLAGALAAAPLREGVTAMYGGRRQYLLSAWRFGPLTAAAAARADWAGAPLRSLLAGIDTLEVPSVGDEAADIDTPDDLRRWQ